MDPAPEPNDQVISLVRGCPAQLRVLGELYLARDKGSLTQADLARRAEVSFGHMTDHLKGLARLGLARCTLPELRKCKPYRITDSGCGVWESIQSSMERETRATEVQREGKVSKL